MKHLKIMLLALPILLLVGCEKQPNKPILEDSSTQQTKQTSTTQETGVKIEDDITKGIFSNGEYTIKYINSEIVKSKYIDKYGVYVTYELTNESDQNIMPFEALNWLELTQQTDNQIVKLDSLYPVEDSAPEGDTEKYNEFIDRDNANNNLLLPHKSMTAYMAYFVKDTSKPIKITVYSQANDQYLGEYTFTPKQ
ncbi:DUF5067 domain-containing protein [Enterococcus cecorum]|uniref:DUF5067 domain-containing protein n=1 Tax=Enterococcus cecorum TaxID=44008 RepID=UPI00200A09C0|nr:DUF5067 domain-containing protein [Enterococcus cecorum]